MLNTLIVILLSLALVAWSLGCLWVAVVFIEACLIQPRELTKDET